MSSCPTCASVLPPGSANLTEIHVQHRSRRATCFCRTCGSRASMSEIEPQRSAITPALLDDGTIPRCTINASHARTGSQCPRTGATSPRDLKLTILSRRADRPGHHHPDSNAMFASGRTPGSRRTAFRPAPCAFHAEFTPNRFNQRLGESLNVRLIRQAQAAKPAAQRPNHGQSCKGLAQCRTGVRLSATSCRPTGTPPSSLRAPPSIPMAGPRPDGVSAGATPFRPKR